MPKIYGKCMDREVLISLMKVLLSLKTLSKEAIVLICGEVKTKSQANNLVQSIKNNPNMSESDILKLLYNLR